MNLFNLDFFINEAIKLHDAKKCLLTAMIGYDTLLNELYCDDTLYLDDKGSQEMSAAYYALEDDIHDKIESMVDLINE